MARKRQDARLGSRSARSSLRQRREPYWRTISKGLALGYRKGAAGGTWIARRCSPETGRRIEALGVADDFDDADGNRVLSFDQAQQQVQTWAKRKAAEDVGEVISGPYTVADAMADYLKDRERARRKQLGHTRYTINAHINPAMGQIQLTKLTHARVKAWRDELAERGPRKRMKPGDTEQQYRVIDASDSDAVRKRFATANRVFTVLRAALNYAFKEGHVGSNAAWVRIKAFRETDSPRVRYLTVDECKRLIEKCPEDFRALVRGALYTGCRYGELTAMRVDAFNADANTIHVVRGKSGKGRYIPLTEEGGAFFRTIAEDRPENESMFTHIPGAHRKADRSKNAEPKPEAWEHSQQRWWMQLICARAKIAPIIGFHILRHTYASQLAMNGTPMPVVAALLGHADTRMTERHYGHLAPSYVADTLRANLPSFGFVPPSNGPVLVSQSQASA